MIILKKNNAFKFLNLATFSDEVELLGTVLNGYLDGKSFEELLTDAVEKPEYRVSSVKFSDFENPFLTPYNLMIFNFDDQSIVLRKSQKSKMMRITHDNLYDAYAFFLAHSAHYKTECFAVDQKYLIINAGDVNKSVNSQWFQSTMAFRPFFLGSKVVHHNLCMSCGTFRCMCTVQDDEAFFDAMPEYMKA